MALHYGNRAFGLLMTVNTLGSKSLSQHNQKCWSKLKVGQPGIVVLFLSIFFHRVVPGSNPVLDKTFMLCLGDYEIPRQMCLLLSHDTRTNL